MTSRTKNVAATALVAATVVLYDAYVVWGEMPFLKDPRGMGATGLIIGVTAAIVVGWSVFHPASRSRAALATGVVALFTGMATVWVGTSEILLAVFIVLILVTWGLGELAYSRSRTTAGRQMAHSH